MEETNVNKDKMFRCSQYNCYSHSININSSRSNRYPQNIDKIYLAVIQKLKNLKIWCSGRHDREPIRCDFFILDSHFNFLSWSWSRHHDPWSHPYHLYDPCMIAHNSSYLDHEAGISCYTNNATLRSLSCYIDKSVTVSRCLELENLSSRQDSKVEKSPYRGSHPLAPKLNLYMATRLPQNTYYTQ